MGKSSLVQVLSSGMPEVCNYPFTTRTVKMGHFFVDGIRHQVSPQAAASRGLAPLITVYFSLVAGDKCQRVAHLGERYHLLFPRL